MKLLVFEYSSVCLRNSLIAEGFYMLNALLSDLEHISFFDTYFLINEKYDSFNFNNCQSIYPNCDIMDWLKNNCHKYDYCMFIAPEDDFVQYNITKILEENNVNVLGSYSKASFICSSKFLTYENVSNKVLKIKTIKLDLNDVDYKKIKNINDSFDLIIKPDNKTSSNLIYHIHSKEELDETLKIYKKNNVNDILLQEFITGEPVSVSVLCDENYVNCISVNSQVIKKIDCNIEYIGCIAPIKHEHENKLYDISREIVQSIPGLKGFVGIDFIIQKDDIYFVEVNARLTTPFIVLQEECNENLTEIIINTIKNKKREKITFEKTGKFTKRG